MSVNIHKLMLKLKLLNIVALNFMLLQLWRRPIPLAKLSDNVSVILGNLYERSDHNDAEINTLIQIWDDITTHLEDTVCDVNVEVEEWLQLLKNTPSECFPYSIFREQLALLKERREVLHVYPLMIQVESSRLRRACRNSPAPDAWVSLKYSIISTGAKVLPLKAKLQSAVRRYSAQARVLSCNDLHEQGL